MDNHHQNSSSAPNTQRFLQHLNFSSSLPSHPYTPVSNQPQDPILPPPPTSLPIVPLASSLPISSLPLIQPPAPVPVPVPVPAAVSMPTSSPMPSPPVFQFQSPAIFLPTTGAGVNPFAVPTPTVTLPGLSISSGLGAPTVTSTAISLPGSLQPPSLPVSGALPFNLPSGAPTVTSSPISLPGALQAPSTLTVSDALPFAAPSAALSIAITLPDVLPASGASGLGAGTVCGAAVNRTVGGSSGSGDGGGDAKDSDTSLRSQLVLRALEQNARALAEADHEALRARRGSGPPRNPAERRKLVRNRSAFLSRQSRRHYAELLAKHVQTIETQRNQTALECHNVSQQIQQLHIALQHLQNTPLSLSPSF